MTRATTDLLDAIHGLVAGALKDELVRAAELAAKPMDDPDYAPISPQLIDKALKFLKDNSITAPASNKPVKDLTEELSALDIDLDEEAAALRH